MIHASEPFILGTHNGGGGGGGVWPSLAVTAEALMKFFTLPEKNMVELVHGISSTVFNYFRMVCYSVVNPRRF
jgi:hypothetical protein